MSKILWILLLLTSPLLAANENLASIKKQWKQAVKNTPAYCEETYCGKGIVIPAGGVHYLTNAYINLHMLRDSGCQLPVEIWYIGKKEVIPAIMDQLTKMGAVCKDITEHFSYPIKGWEVKIHSIIASSFEEVMLLDADNVVFQNPEFLFDSPEYINTGALFWPDIQGLKKDNLLWSVLNLPAQEIHGQESGQLVINKKKCWAPLYLCLHMNKKSQFYYQHLWGDKDTFQLSWKTLGYPFHMMKYIPGILKNNFLSKTFGYGQIQRDFKGAPLFCHTTTHNWAQRKDFKKLFEFYTLPTRDLNSFDREQDEVFADFDILSPNFESQCLLYLAQVKELLKER